MPQENPPSDNPETRENQGKKILIADDRYENRYYLETLLKGNGYQVVSVKNGEEALAILKSERIDAIITDILMPVMDGYSLCKLVKGDPQLTHIPFIFSTASYTEQRHKEFGLSLSADEYISKPIEPDEFIKVVRRVLHENEQE